MYLAHFKLKEKPFRIGTDGKFLWLGRKQREALRTLKDALQNGRGYLVVTGEIGAGKTMLACALVNELRGQAVVAKVSYPDIDSVDFFRLVLASFNVAERPGDQVSFLAQFESFLRGTPGPGKPAVLIIDEAQKLSGSNLVELLHLSRVEDTRETLKLVFFGQNEFNTILSDDCNVPLRQRISTNYSLGPLSEEETRDYILHRLEVAGGGREIFTEEALKDVFVASGGIPRRINIICDLGLLLACLERKEIVSRQAIRQCLDRLHVPGEEAVLPV
jgi:general secretion pathway protein A